MTTVYRLLARDAPRDAPPGFCRCGCGERTKLATAKFLSGHGNRPVDEPWDVRDMGYETPCWVWTAGLMGEGYATQAPRGGGSTLVHRQHYEEKHGAVPAGLDLDHLCRVRACVNPDHVEPVTRAENARRGAARGQSSPSQRSKRSAPPPNRTRNWPNGSAYLPAPCGMRAPEASGRTWHERLPCAAVLVR